MSSRLFGAKSWMHMQFSHRHRSTLAVILNFHTHVEESLDNDASRLLADILMEKVGGVDNGDQIADKRSLQDEISSDYFQILRRSILLSAIAVFEDYLNYVCGALETKLALPLCLNDISEKEIIKRAFKYISKVARLEGTSQIMSSKQHGTILNAYKLRNAIVHRMCRHSEKSAVALSQLDGTSASLDDIIILSRSLVETVVRAITQCISEIEILCSANVVALKLDE